MKRPVLMFVLAAYANFPAPGMAEPIDENDPPPLTTSKESTEEQAELHNLLALLEAETEIATRTKLNADYVPGMVTVLHGDELEARGLRTVWEALSLVPGIDISIEPTGHKQVLTRGIGKTFASGNVKILLNDVSMNSARLALVNPVLNIPVEQVERIEVIRGPGSAIHGEFAYAGVVNVITRREGRRVFGAYGSYEAVTGGGIFSWSNPENQLNMSLNLAGWQSDGANVRAGEDALYNDSTVPNSASNAPGPANEKAEARSAIFSLDHKKSSLLAQWTEDGLGDHFGINDILPPDEGKIVTRFKHRAVEARQAFAISPALHSRLTLGWQQSEDLKNRMYVGPPELFGGSAGDPAVFLNAYYQEEKRYAGIDMDWTGWDRHKLLFALSYSRIEVKDAWQEFNLDPVTFLPSTTFTRFAPTIAEDTKRTIKSLTLQDEFRASDIFTLTAGLRHDDYDDAGSSLTPRLAGVWRLDDRHILKAQYARAFRPPTFYEIIDNVDPATIDTIEAGYIYKGNRSEGRITLFYSMLDKLIVFDETSFSHINTDGAILRGAEFELERRLSSRLKLDTNLSYVDTEDQTTNKQVPGSSNWLGNVGLILQPRGNLSLALQYRYVGDFNRETTDPRDKMDGYQTTDLTASLFNAGARGMTLRLGVKNLFDEEVRYPAPMITDAVGNPIISYNKDYPRPGRNGWLQISYSF